MEGVQEKRGMSTGAKWGIGCGIGCLTTLILVGVLAFVAYRFTMAKVEEATLEFREMGFELTTKGQQINVTEDIAEQRLYVGQIVKVFGDCTTNLAILAQMAEIHGKIDGKLYFRGQMLTVHSNAHVVGGIDVKAQLLQVHGKVDGGITGEYQQVQGATTP